MVAKWRSSVLCSIQVPSAAKSTPRWGTVLSFGGEQAARVPWEDQIRLFVAARQITLTERLPA